MPMRWTLAATCCNLLTFKDPIPIPIANFSSHVQEVLLSGSAAFVCSTHAQNGRLRQGLQLLDGSMRCLLWILSLRAVRSGQSRVGRMRIV